MADANQKDLSQFERWYSQAGTPQLAVRGHYDAKAQRFSLTLTQSYPANPAIKTAKDPLLIPFAMGLVMPDGSDLPLKLESESGNNATTAGASSGSRVFELTERDTTLHFIDVPAEPIPSLLRGFSAPVVVDYAYTDPQLAFLLAHDSDPFNRWEAGQRLATRALIAASESANRGEAVVFDDAVVNAYGLVLRDASLAPAFRELVLTLPSESYLIEQLAEANPAAVHLARQTLRKQLANALQGDWLTVYRAQHIAGEYRPTPQDAGQRGLKNLALAYLAECDDPQSAADAALVQYDSANNMTDRFAALSVLVRLGGDAARTALDHFYRMFEKEALVVDKWFALQAVQSSTPNGPTIDVVKGLFDHQAFTLRNPNRARSLIFSFCAANLSEFHRADGSGYAFWADQVIALDMLNPQVAARLARTLERWRKFTPALQEKMHAALEKVSAQVRSKDVREIVEKALAD
jgi:aminopeptidase N